jgi:prepilin-type N-terminal cleavage/methylation domain-containing protein
MPNLPPSLSTARRTGGFTLVELLVVIGIIAILAGVALGPITNGIKKAQESGAMQTCRTLALAEFQYQNDQNGSYPDGTSAGDVGTALINGNYISDPSIFYIAADKTASGTLKKAATTTTFVAANSSFDFSGTGTVGGTGVGSSAPDQLPLVWDEGDAGCTLVTGGCYITKTAATGVFGADGKAVAYHSNNAFFRTPAAVTDPSGKPAANQITFVDQSFTVPTGVTYAVLPGASGK